MINTNLHIQEAQQTSSMINSKTFIPRHMMLKHLKTKDKEGFLICNYLEEISPTEAKKRALMSYI